MPRTQPQGAAPGAWGWTFPSTWKKTLRNNIGQMYRASQTLPAVPEAKLQNPEPTPAVCLWRAYLATAALQERKISSNRYSLFVRWAKPGPHAAEGSGLRFTYTIKQMRNLPKEMLLHPSHPLRAHSSLLTACQAPGTGSRRLPTGNAVIPGEFPFPRMRGVVFRWEEGAIPGRSFMFWMERWKWDVCDVHCVFLRLGWLFCGARSVLYINDSMG